jgi:AcrR family transcriptional regulator
MVSECKLTNMSTQKTNTPTRSSAQDRREAILEAAIVEFARNGLAGSSTEAISARVGISQPYLFKLFGTKRALFIAAYELVMTRIDNTLDEAALAHPDNPNEAMDNAYQEVLKRKAEQLLLLQAYAAAGDPEVKAYVHERERRTFAEIVEACQGDIAHAKSWYANCLLQTLGTVLDLPEFLE